MKTTFLKSKGGGQFFKLNENGTCTIVCTYPFNPLIERTRLREETLNKLGNEVATPEEFAQAMKTAMNLIEGNEVVQVANVLQNGIPATVSEFLTPIS